MARVPANGTYRWLAQYYDQLFAVVRDPINSARDRVLARIIPGVTTACDLACGTGATALVMAAREIKTYAVDLSPVMCRLTRQKARESRLTVRVLRADMRTFRLPESVDLITCEFDALNHVPRHSDLRRVAAAVNRALRPGGYFFFDVNNARGFQRYWSGTVWIEKPGVAVLMRNGHTPQADRAWIDVDWFIRDGNRWVRRHERVDEVCWNPQEIRQALEAAGFDRLRSWDAAPFFKNSVITHGCRTIYLARKCRA